MADVDIAVVGWAVSAMERRTAKTEQQMLFEVVSDAVEHAGITRADVDFTVAGSCDYVAGQAFSFVQNIDAVGAWPPKRDSHVEMDGAWALYETWIRLLEGDLDIALATGSGRSSTADPALIYPMEMDPYYLAPLGVDALSFGALQARAMVDAGRTTEREMAEIAARCRRDAQGNPHAQVSGALDVEAALGEEPLRAPLRRHDMPPVTDGAACVVIARGDRARELCENPVWIRGFAHYSELHNPGMRDLLSSPSTTLAAKAAGVEEAPVDFAELQTAFSHEEVLLREALGLSADTPVNRSGGPLAANPVMATGLVRIAETARQIRAGQGRRGLAHATSGPCLQQNLVCVLEGDKR